MTNLRKLIAVIVTTAVALILEFGFKQPNWAYGLIVVMGVFIAIEMTMEIIETLKEGRIGVDVLALTAVVSTLIVGEYWAAAMIAVMMYSGGALEDYAEGSATRELQSLLDNSPTIAHRYLSNGDLEDVQVDTVKVGDTILVRAGEMVPVDGEVLQGTSLVNEASLTGESEPVEKNPGDDVMSGVINGDTALTMRVTHAPEDSQYQTLVRLVEESQENPADFVKLADRIAVPFTIIAYAIGIIAAVVAKDPVRFAEVMVVASPCPLILSAPIALVSGMNRASKNGIIVKSGNVLEILSETNTLGFDKTGTITMGELAVDEVVPVEGVSQEELLSLAASAELGSVHVLATSLINAAEERGLDLTTPSNLTEFTGQGIEARIDGAMVHVGKAMFAHNKGQTVDQTAVYVSRNQEYLGRITFLDVFRPEAKLTVNKLRDLGVEHIVMLTGDKKDIAYSIADEVGITEVQYEQLPQDKLDYIKGVQASGERMAMVGDGINDAPALALADVGIAMGFKGSSAASESADAVIVKDDIHKVAQLVTISQDTMKVTKQASYIGIAVSLVLMIIAAFGFIPALLGAIFQEVLDVLSMFWAIRARGGRSLEK